MVTAICCGHPDNLEESDESEWGTVARPRLTVFLDGAQFLTPVCSSHLSYRRIIPLPPTAQPIFLLKWSA
jgi:hypothetical protein